MTTLKTGNYIINGTKQTVETIHLNDNRQNIAYKVQGKLIHFDKFWGKKPVEVKN